MEKVSSEPELWAQRRVILDVPVRDFAAFCDVDGLQDDPSVDLGSGGSLPLGWGRLCASCRSFGAKFRLLSTGR